MDTEDTKRTSFEANESVDVVSKLPAKIFRENDIVLGVLFNGYVFANCSNIDELDKQSCFIL
jgi:hypothetical protein